MKANFFLLIFLSTLLGLTYYLVEVKQQEDLASEKVIAHLIPLKSVRLKNIHLVKKEQWQDKSGHPIKMDLFNELEHFLEQLKSKRSFHPQKLSAFFSDAIEFSLNEKTYLVGDLNQSQDGFYLKEKSSQSILLIDLSAIGSKVIAQSESELNLKKYQYFLSMLKASEEIWRENRVLFLFQPAAFDALKFKGKEVSFKQMEVELKDSFTKVFSDLSGELSNKSFSRTEAEIEFYYQGLLQEKWQLYRNKGLYLGKKANMIKLSQEDQDFDKVLASLIKKANN